LGQIAGYYQDSSGLEHGFLDNRGTYTRIDPPGSVSTTVTGINNKGQIVGYYEESSGGPAQSFLYSRGTYTVLDVPGATNTLAYSVNDSGQITGFYQDSGGQEHGFLYSRGTYTTINPPGGIGATANRINNSGQVVGYSFGNGIETGFLATQTHQLLTQAIASFSPTALGTGSPLGQVRDDMPGQTDHHLAPPH
jgi:probable HAF family extracellular repeat protein